MATRRAFVHRVPMGAPDDVSALQAAMAQGRIDPAAIVAILGKTEGNGCVNDFTRGFASMVLARTLAAASPATADGVCLVMSGGTEGGLSPHATVIESRATDEPAEAGALAVPLLTAGRVAEAEARGQRTATRDTLKSMGLSRAASALGVGLALDEIPLTTAFDTVIGTDFSVYSGRASTSAGVELAEHEIVVLGTAPGWAGPLRIDHAVMADGLDVEPVRAALARLGLEAAGQLDPHQRGRLVALLAKAEAGSTGRLRGFRHTMLDDSDLSATRHARGFVAGALGSLVGHAEIYVSGGAEHQGPDGGGPVALIVSSR